MLPSPAQGKHLKPNQHLLCCCEPMCGDPFRAMNPLQGQCFHFLYSALQQKPRYIKNQQGLHCYPLITLQYTATLQVSREQWYPSLCHYGAGR